MVRALLLAAVLALSAPSCILWAGLGFVSFVVYEEPPPDRFEWFPDGGGRPGQFWVHGHWAWYSRAGWTWVPGHWMHLRCDHYWEEGYWARRGGAWHWVPGRWRYAPGYGC